MSVDTRFAGRILTVNIEQVMLPDGQLARLEIAHHPGGSAVVALDDGGRVCLLHQYRHAAGGWLWELPAGKIDHREPPIETARRELAEEAGCEAAQWTSLGGVLSSPGVLTEVIHLYLARTLKMVPRATEAHEVLTVHWLPVIQAIDMLSTGEIRDAKTLAGLVRAQALLRA